MQIQVTKSPICHLEVHCFWYISVAMIEYKYFVAIGR